MFAGLRRTVDDPERGLLARADEIAGAALREAESGKAQDAGTLAGLVEQSARLAGAEEVYIAIAPDLASDTRLNRTSQPLPLADRFAVRASVAYKGCWVRRVRTFTKDSTAKADDWFAELIQSLVADKPISSQIAAKTTKLPGAVLKGFSAESCVGSYPLSAIASSRLSDSTAPASGQFIVLTVELTVDGAPWIGAAPLIAGSKTL